MLAPLAAYPSTIPEAGGSLGLYLDNPGHRNRPYVVLVSASGTQPGFRLGTARVPLNPDVVSTFALTQANTAPFASFVGTLDGNGLAEARFTAPRLPGVAGQKLWFAYVQGGSVWDFASNAVEVTFVR